MVLGSKGRVSGPELGGDVGVDVGVDVDAYTLLFHRLHGIVALIIAPPMW